MMRKMKRLMLLVPATLIMHAGTVHAAEAIPPLKSAKRIPWAIKCAGPMPKLLAISLVVICALIIVSIILYKTGGGHDEH